MTKAVVTGLGPVSAIGEGVDQFWEALLGGHSGIGPITRCDVSRSTSKIGAEVRNFRLDRYIEDGRAIARTAPRPAALAPRWEYRPQSTFRTFRIDRDATVIGDGAAAFVVESEAFARRRGARAYATIAGSAVQSSGRRRYHATRPALDPRPCVRAL